jgi:hypothetical protein
MFNQTTVQIFFYSTFNFVQVFNCSKCSICSTGGLRLGIAKNHPLSMATNGPALVVVRHFLLLNGLDLNASQKKNILHLWPRPMAARPKTNWRDGSGREL